MAGFCDDFTDYLVGLQGIVLYPRTFTTNPPEGNEGTRGLPLFTVKREGSIRQRIWSILKLLRLWITYTLMS